MSLKKLSVVLGVLLVASMILTACPAPQPQVVEKVVTQVVEKEVKVVETQVVETVKEVVKEVQVVATAVPVAEEKMLRINLGSYPDIIDPQKSSFVNEIAHLQMMYEGLTKLDKDLNTVPGAAEKWEYSEDLKTITFTLRKDLKYSDGSPLNAARYAYSIKRNINPETAGEYAQITDEIMGAPEWRGCGEDAAVCEAAAAAARREHHAAPCGRHRLRGRERLRRCRVRHPEDHALQAGPVLPHGPVPVGHLPGQGREHHRGRRALVEQLQVAGRQRPVHPEEPGALREGSLHARTRTTGAASPRSTSSTPTSPTTAVAFEAYKNDEFDIVGLAAEDLAVVQADPVLSKEANIYPGSCTYALMFHQLKEPFTDQKVREAFAMAIDRETWVRGRPVRPRLADPHLDPAGVTQATMPTRTAGAYDVEAAKKAIAESSYGSIDKLPPITATFSDTPRNRTRWEWLAAKWKDVLGVEVKLDPVEPTTYTALTKDISDCTADVHPGLVRRLSGSAELAERLLEDRRLRPAHRLLERGASISWWMPRTPSRIPRSARSSMPTRRRC